MKAILIALFISNSIFSIAQEEKITFKNDISLSGGISLSDDSFGRYGIIYRRSLNESSNLKFSGYFDRSHSTFNKNLNPLFSSDSMLILRNNQTLSNQYLIKIGLDRSLFRIFYTGVDINLGYSSQKNITIDEGSKYNSDIQKWQNCNECVYEYHNIDAYEFTSQTNGHPDYVRIDKGDDYFVIGLSLNVGVQYPISNRWELALQYSPELLSYLSLNNGTSVKKFRHYTDLILRFKL